MDNWKSFGDCGCPDFFFYYFLVVFFFFFTFILIHCRLLRMVLVDSEAVRVGYVYVDFWKERAREATIRTSTCMHRYFPATDDAVDSWTWVKALSQAFMRTYPVPAEVQSDGSSRTFPSFLRLAMPI